MVKAVGAALLPDHSPKGGAVGGWGGQTLIVVIFYTTEFLITDLDYFFLQIATSLASKGPFKVKFMLQICIILEAF